MNHSQSAVSFGPQENCYQTRVSRKPWIAWVPKRSCMNSGVRLTGVFDYNDINPSPPLGPIKFIWCPVKKTFCNLKYRILNSQWPNESTFVWTINRYQIYSILVICEIYITYMISISKHQISMPICCNAVQATTDHKPLHSFAICRICWRTAVIFITKYTDPPPDLQIIVYIQNCLKKDHVNSAGWLPDYIHWLPCFQCWSHISTCNSGANRSPMARIPKPANRGSRSRGLDTTGMSFFSRIAPGWREVGKIGKAPPAL